MSARYREVLAALEQAVLTGSGTLDPAVRRRAAQGEAGEQPLAGYLDKVHRHAYRITDEDVAALHQAGYTDDQIFEATISAALGEGLERIEVGMAALAALEEA